MLYLSKSKYTKLWQCPKMLWLMKNKPEEAPRVDPGLQARLEEGNEVGDLAMGLFGDFVEVTAFKDDGSGSLDLSKMIDLTKEEMAKGTENICEASFSYSGLYCAVDVLRKEGAGWAIYEVKSSTHPERAVYIADIAYQKYVLENCGVKVTGTYIVTINNEYIRGKTLDIKKLFNVTDVREPVEEEYPKVKQNIELAERVMASKKEPETDVSAHCIDPYECEFLGYCLGELPEPSVFDLSGFGFAKALPYYQAGSVDFESLRASKEIRNEKQLLQIEHELEDRPSHIDKEGIKEFLDTLYYPLYFLDFETMQPTIPPFQGTKAFQKIPFQYSLHYIETERGELKHKEFLGEPGKDPRRGIAEALVNDIPRDACVMAYNMGFEKGQIKELASAFPDLSDHLMSIRDNIVDLMMPFQKGHYYNREMQGSYSIKYVLPALFPDDPELDYHNLEGVHNGGEAMSIYPQIQFVEPEEAEKAKRNLLKYCELDTFAMVKIWQKLKEVCK